MKRHTALLLLFSTVSAPGVSVAQEAWLMLQAKEHAGIYRAEKGEMRQVARVGQSVIAAYGETERTLAVISQRTPADQILLQIIDKKSERTTATWPLQGFPVLQLSGPSRDVALTDEFAYYVTIRSGKDGKSIEPNERGGSYDFYRVSLANGRLDRFPFGPECSNPRVITFNGSPLIYSWNGYGVWRFNSDRSELDALVLRRDIDDTIVSDEAGTLAATKPRSFADYVAIPGVGLFRTSQLGELKQVLDASLRRIGVPGATLNLSQKGDVIRTFPGAFDNKPAIGVVVSKEKELRYAAVDPVAMKVLREVALPEHAVLDSVTILRDGSIAYVDRQAAAIRRIAGGEIEMLWTVKGRVPPEYLDYARIIALDP